MVRNIIFVAPFWTVSLLISLFLLTVKSCEVGKYGPNCEHQCHCLVNSLCKQGLCSGICERGYTNVPYCNQLCPSHKFGLECRFDCHCINDEDCNKVNGDCPSKQCSYQYGGAGCQRRLPRIPRAPSILHLSCNNVTLGWDAFNPSSDDGEGPIGQYLVQLKTEDAESWNNPVNVTDKQDRRPYYTAVITTGLLSDTNHLFRIDVQASAHGKLQSNIQAGLPSFPVMHACQTWCDGLTFGDKCQHQCHCHNNADCHKVSGSCPNGQCDKEYEGTNCQRRLPKSRYPPKLLFISCNNITVTWDSFIQWHDIGYGPIFQYNLYYKEYRGDDSGTWINPVNTSHTGQHNFIYSVTSGLQPDYEYLFRVDIVGTNTKPHRTVPGPVNRFLNKCSRCPRNRYGRDCNEDCHCEGNKDCDKDNGQCPYGQCHPEWHGSSCERRLPLLIKPPRLVTSACKNITLSWKSFNHSVDIGDGPVGAYRVMSQAVMENASVSWVEVDFIYSDDRPIYTVSVTREMLVNHEYLFRVDVLGLHNNVLIFRTTPGVSTCPILNRCLTKPVWKEINSVGMRFVFIVAHLFPPSQGFVYVYSRDNSDVTITCFTTRVSLNVQKSKDATVYQNSIEMFNLSDLSEYVKKGVSWSDLLFEMTGDGNFGVNLILERAGLHLAAMALLPVSYWGETYFCFGLKRSQNVYILNERAGNEIIVACSLSKKGANITIPYNTIHSVYVDVCRAENNRKPMGISLSGKYPFGVITVDSLDDMPDFCGEAESFVGQDMALPMKSFGTEFMTFHTNSMPYDTYVLVQALHAYTLVTLCWYSEYCWKHYEIGTHMGIVTIRLPGYDRRGRRIKSTLPVQVILVLSPSCPWAKGAEDVAHTILMPDDLFYNTHLIGLSTVTSMNVFAILVISRAGYLHLFHNRYEIHSNVEWLEVYGRPGWYISEIPLTVPYNNFTSRYLFTAYVYGLGTDTRKAYLHSAGFKSCRYVTSDMIAKECDKPPIIQPFLQVKGNEVGRSKSVHNQVILDWLIWTIASNVAIFLM